jgi:hypothetical protein
MILKKIINISALMMICSLSAQEKFEYKSENSAIKTAENVPVDVVFHSKKSNETNPFDVTFGGIVTHEKNQSFKVQGFYNGSDEYVLRFSSDIKGNFKFTTFSSDKKLAGLNGRFSVVENSNKENLGAVIVDPKSQQKLSHKNGKPYFALSFELDWLFDLDSDNKKAIPKTEQIIKTVKENGFNQVVMNIYAYDVKWPVANNVPEKYNFKKPDYTVFGGTNEKPDFSTLNVDFFKHFDRVIQHLNENGIVAHVMIYVWNKQVNWPEMYSADDNRYFNYVIKR